MKFDQCSIKGAWVIDPQPHEDHRGRFFRSWCGKEFADQSIEFQPVQANIAYSIAKGTLRGLHHQVEPALEAKLVRCTRGSVFDVVADLRPDSPTFLGWFGTKLTPENGRMLFLPEGCAHGCLSLEDASEIFYLTSAYYAPDCARGVRHDDPAIGIAWPAPVSTVSEQDGNWPLIGRDHT